MKGPKVLRLQEIHELYQTIARFPLSVSEKNLVHYTQLSRLDARLAEVVTEHIRDFWWKYDPVSINRRIKAQTSPAAIRPMIAQILGLCEGDKLVKTAFGKWAAAVLAGVSKAHPQLYFVPSLRPRSKSFDREVSEARAEFVESGFYSRALLFNKGIPGSIKSFANAPMNTETRTKAELYLKLRPHLQITLKELEDRLGVDRTTLSEIRSGQLHKIGIKRLASLVDKLVV